MRSTASNLLGTGVATEIANPADQAAASFCPVIFPMAAAAEQIRFDSLFQIGALGRKNKLLTTCGLFPMLRRAPGWSAG